MKRLVPRRSLSTTHVWLMLALTFSTGVVDAVGYLGLDRVFTGNMTGNVVILGMGLADVADLPVLGPLVALLGFITGAAFGGRTLHRSTRGWSGYTTGILIVVASVQVTLAIVTVVESSLSRTAAAVLVATLGMAMGLQAATARHIAVQDVTTVAVTATIAGLAADSAVGPEGLGYWRRRIGAILLIGLGACTGALLLQIHIAAGLALAAAITVSVTVLGHRSRSPVQDLTDLAAT